MHARCCLVGLPSALIAVFCARKLSRGGGGGRRMQTTAGLVWDAVVRAPLHRTQGLMFQKIVSRAKAVLSHILSLSGSYPRKPRRHNATTHRGGRRDKECPPSLEERGPIVAE